MRGLKPSMSTPEADRHRGLAGRRQARSTAALQVHGLATTLGRVSTTGVAGFTMGGGSGWAERKFGFSTDNLLAATLVTAEGEVITTDEETEPDLFLALRGGWRQLWRRDLDDLRAYPKAWPRPDWCSTPPPKAPRSCGVYETSCSRRRTTRRPRSSTCMAPKIPRSRGPARRAEGRLLGLAPRATPAKPKRNCAGCARWATAGGLGRAGSLRRARTGRWTTRRATATTSAPTTSVS